MRRRLQRPQGASRQSNAGALDANFEFFATAWGHAAAPVLRLRDRRALRWTRQRTNDTTSHLEIPLGRARGLQPGDRLMHQEDHPIGTVVAVDAESSTVKPGPFGFRANVGEIVFIYGASR